MINDQRLIKLLQKTISYDSQNPPGNELELAKFIEKDMRSLGLDVKIVTYAKNRPNIIATLRGTLPRAQAAKEAILLTPHFDTVPIGQGWKFKPFGGEIVGGKLYGRGSTDDKGNLASCMEVMRSLVEDKVKLRKDVIMAATVDEETGSQYGIVPLLDKKVLKPGFALVMDSNEFDAIVAQKGLLHTRIQIFGKKAHGAYNWLGVNSIEIAARVINKLKNLKFKYKKHPYLHGPTMNIGVIKGGDKVNMVCDFCEFALDTRYPPDMNVKDVLKTINNVVASEAKKFKVVIDDSQMPYEINPKHPCVDLWSKTCKKFGAKATIKGSEGATVITFFKKHGIPAFATGFGAHKTAHTNDEYCFVKSLTKGTRVLEEYVKAYDQL